MTSGEECVGAVSGQSDGVVPVIGSAFLGELVASIEAQVAMLSRVQTVSVSNADRRALVVRVEAVCRSLFGLSHTWIADLVDQRGLEGLGGSSRDALSMLLRVSPTRAGQRLRMSELFGERTAFTGERLAPVLPRIAAAAEDGVIDEEHQVIVRRFFRQLSAEVDVESRERAEWQLASLARQLGPREFEAAAQRLFEVLDPDGSLKDEREIARQCYFRLQRQGKDGLSKGTFVVDGETRAYLEAAFAKWAKPGMCNPNDPDPIVDDPDDSGSDDRDPEPDADAGGGGGVDVSGPTLFDPDPGGDCGGVPDGGGSGGSGAAESVLAAAARRDVRGVGQRQHDAVKVILRQMLASGALGAHRGLPVTAVVSMTLKELESGAGFAVTATGSLVRMRDAIRMASHAHRYLVVFDDVGRPLHLGRSKRIASADQRIVLTAADRGCTFPGCTRPATWSQVHHIDEWAAGGGTDIESLTFGCDGHHRLVGSGELGWATSKAGPGDRYPGRTRWHPPAVIDPRRRGRVNHFHHPGEYIYPAAPTEPAEPAATD